MADAFRLSVLTPGHRVFSGTVTSLVAPGHLGDFAVLPGHVAYITAVKPGALVWEHEGERIVRAVGEGFAQVSADKVSIVVTRCEDPATFDATAIRASLEAAQKTMVETDPSERAWIDAQWDQSMAQGRLSALERVGGQSH